MGAMALFGEKYGEKVRVVVFDSKYSVELCAGTHISSTGKIGLFKIIHESSVAAGVRRIEAYTGNKAIDYVNNKLEILEEVRALMKHPKDLKRAVAELIAERSSLSHKVEKLEREKTGNMSSGLSEKIKDGKNGKLLAERIDLPNAQALKDVLFGLKSSHKDLVALIGSEIDGKPMIGMITGDEINEKKIIHVGKMIGELAKEIGGGGGGQEFFATAGGKNPKGLDKAIKKGEEMISIILNGE